MTSLDSATEVAAFLDRAVRRQRWLLAAQGAAGGLALAAVMSGVGHETSHPTWSRILLASFLAAGGAAWRWRSRRPDARNVAYRLERRTGDFANLLITAQELLAVTWAEARDEPVARLVLDRTAEVARRHSIASLLPSSRSVMAVATVTAVWLLVITRGAATLIAAAHRAESGAAVVTAMEVVVTPPPYTGGSVRTLHNPLRIDAIAGSRLVVRIDARAASITVTTLATRHVLAPGNRNTFLDSLVVEGDGYLVVEPRNAAGQAGERQLIGIVATIDQPPRVRITAPAHDVTIPDGHQHLAVAIDADDDLALASLRLHYTKVSGSGEQYTFVEGDVPVAINRADPRHWTARLDWALDALALQPGDVVVYRAQASDRRPGAGRSESDSWIAEVASPGGAAAAGFTIADDEQRYAVSQQMVILKTERLLAKASRLAHQEYADSAADLSAEERKVRAEFVFMMGGEVGDDQGQEVSATELNETAEAAGESDLAAGRMLNQGRAALLGAIRYMSLASASLTAVTVDTALTQERTALADLERAFSHTRILLRALSVRERLDLTRRLTGTLAHAFRDIEPPTPAPVNRRDDSLRAVLAGVATLTTLRDGATAAARAVALAEATLRIDASQPAMRRTAALLNQASARFGDTHPAAARALVDQAATVLAQAIRSDQLDAPHFPGGPATSSLAGLLRDALRHPLP
jgi:hypothetical protein